MNLERNNWTIEISCFKVQVGIHGNKVTDRLAKK